MIDHLQLNIEDGFSVITGETGSGKSILLGALGLILGERADLSSVRNTDNKCIVEGTFLIDKEDYEKHFTKHDLDFEKETIIRREISANGKSRAFINDTPVTINVLKEFGEQLIDIHSQHETLLIHQSSFILQIIDSQANTADLLKQYKENLHQYHQELTVLNDLRERESSGQQRADYLKYLLEEFGDLNLESYIADQIENEYTLLNNSEEIKAQLSTCSNYLSGENSSNNVLSLIKEAQSALGNISQINNDFKELSDRLHSVLIELQDINNDCQRKADMTDLNEDRLHHLNEIISQVNRLLKKHQMSSAEELMVKKQELEIELESFQSIDKDIIRQEKVVAELKSILKSLSEDLRKLRMAITPKLETLSKDLLVEMNMKNAELKFQFEKLSDFTASGMDNVNILVKTNLGAQFEPLKKIASGGETSRIMLAIKALQSQNKSLPTIIFDEIDTGVSGEVAAKMGDIMKELAKKMQVLSITHLPQIAAKGKQHYKVYKTEENDHTTTNIIPLDSGQRVDEIAQMLSGSDISEAAIKNAKTLLKGN